MSESKHDKTEQPTHKKKYKARQKGQVVQSNELKSALLLLVGAGTLRFYGEHLFESIVHRVTLSLSTLTNIDVSQGSVPDIFADWLGWFAVTLLPLMIAVAVAGIGFAGILQGGIVWSTQSLALNPGRLNPVEGMKRLFGARIAFNLFRDLLKVTLIALVFYFTVSGAISWFLRAADAGLFDTLLRVSSLTTSLFLQAGLVLLVVGLIDYAYQKRQYTKDLMMSKRELKDEYKESEGDPLVKGRIRSEQKELARRRMMQAVPDADLVLTNPTHYAVALKYDPDGMAAPQVVAKGQRLIAKKIKEIARAAGVPVVEDKFLARSLFRSTEIGQEVPVALYRAVAEILSHVYRTQGRMQQLKDRS